MIRFRVPTCPTALEMAKCQGLYNQRDIEAAAKIDLIAQAASLTPTVLHKVLAAEIENTPDIISILVGCSVDTQGFQKLGWVEPHEKILSIVGTAKSGIGNKFRPVDEYLATEIKNILSERW